MSLFNRRSLVTAIQLIIGGLVLYLSNKDAAHYLHLLGLQSVLPQSVFDHLAKLLPWVELGLGYVLISIPIGRIPGIRSPFQLILGAILLYAAYAKITVPWMNFMLTVDSYQLLPDWGVVMVARLLPWFELILGLVVLSGFALRWSGIATVGIMALFFSMVARAYIRGLTIDCGCFGSGEKLDWMTLIRDGSFVAMAVIMTVTAFWPQRRAGH